MEIKEIIAKMVNVLSEIEAHTEDMKQLKEEVKVIGADPVVVAAVAKSIFDGKSEKLRAKSEEILELLEQQNS